MKELVDYLKNNFKGEIRLDEPMSRHTSFHIGGPADIFLLPDCLEDIQETVRMAEKNNIPLFILGKGSNILVKEEGIRGIVLKTFPGLKYLSIDDEIITAGAGIALPFLAIKAMQNNLTGLEFVAGIPGTVGGAVVMNAGAVGHCLAEVLSKVKVMDQSGDITILPVEQLELGYRQSKLQKKNLLVLEAQFQLTRGEKEKIKERVDSLLGKRKRSQPLSWPNAGSIFRNPQLAPAGKLIELAGGKGKRIGDAQISEMHANFIVNLGNAKADEVLELIEEVKKIVKNKFDVDLEPEVKVVGG